MEPGSVERVERVRRAARVALAGSPGAGVTGELGPGEATAGRVAMVGQVAPAAAEERVALAVVGGRVGMGVAALEAAALRERGGG